MALADEQGARATEATHRARLDRVIGSFADGGSRVRSELCGGDGDGGASGNETMRSWSCFPVLTRREWHVLPSQSLRG